MKKYKLVDPNKIREVFHTVKQLADYCNVSSNTAHNIIKHNIVTVTQYLKLIKTPHFKESDFELVTEDLMVYYKGKKFNLSNDDKQYLIDQIKLGSI